VKLAVVTLTRGGDAPHLAEATASVQAALPEYGTHFVYRTHHFQRDRWESTVGLDAEYVAWVDDDDRVLPGAIDSAVRALDATGAAIAFTLERKINAAGEPLPWAPPPHQHTKRDVAMHPRSLHHLTVLRASCVDDEVYQHAARIGVGMDWLIRAWCTLKYGAVVVPQVGYEWRQHAGQDTRNPTWTRTFEAAMPELRRVTRSWMTYDAPIDRILPG
jgi:hypothetical protein